LNGVLRTLSEFDPFILMTNGATGLFEYLTGIDLTDVTRRLNEAFDIDLYQAGVNMITSLSGGIWSLLTSMVEGIQAKLSEIVPDWMRDAWNWAKGDGRREEAGFGKRSIVLRGGDGPAKKLMAGEDHWWNLFGRDGGGPIRRGVWYEVNERGIEGIQANFDGRIIPARDLSAMIDRRPRRIAGCGK